MQSKHDGGICHHVLSAFDRTRSAAAENERPDRAAFTRRPGDEVQDDPANDNLH